MMNKHAGKVRLTFKLEQDQLWIGTKERTDKIAMSSIKDVYSEAIHDHPQYHVLVKYFLIRRVQKVMCRNNLKKKLLT